MGECLSSHSSNRENTTMEMPVIIPAAVKHTASVIFMHGLGDTGHGWAAAFQTISASHVKYVCPTAPTMPVTLNAGFQMPSWFDIKSLSVDSEQDEDGIKKATQMVHGLIEDEIKAGIPTERIILGGFSQGGALALYGALTYPKKLAGILALSAWLPLHQKLLQESEHSINKTIPILQCHGDIDPLVVPGVGQLTAKILKSVNPNHEFKMYSNMAHSSCEQELQDVKEFIADKLPPV